MPTSSFSLTPDQAWQPLPLNEWNESAVRHLLSRLGWTATAAETERTLKEGPVAAMRRYFARLPSFSMPPLVAKIEEETPEIARQVARGDESEKRMARRVARERFREGLFELTIHWLQHAAKPENAPAEKWLLFLSDVWVVGSEKVRNPVMLYQHQELLRAGGLSNYPLLTKALSRSPAMVQYLDLQQNKASAPNENFARELFELFTLGEGNYTENDIKEAARAFTGYRQQTGKFSFQRRQHDSGRKTVFGRTGAFTGDDVIDLVFQQKAAGSFLVREMSRFYLSEHTLPAAYADGLGAWWAKQDYNLGKLVVAFFTSRLFYAPEFRANFIKSPIQYYLGLMQDLSLTPPPLPRRAIASLRQMGQTPFNPPNVRGWVGGKSWINSATLAARRATANALLSPVPEALLNGDERAALRAAGDIGDFTVRPERFIEWAKLSSEECARVMVSLALPRRINDARLLASVAELIDDGSQRRDFTLRAVLATLLESPDYQLC